MTSGCETDASPSTNSTTLGLAAAKNYGRKLLILMVGAGRFERPIPCAQDMEASRLAKAGTYSDSITYERNIYIKKTQV